MIHKFASRLALPIQPKTTVFVSWSRLITRAQVMIPESIYEVVTRPNKPAASWENPENPQHQQAFVSLYDDVKRVTVANKGLHEYEILGTTPWL